MNTGISVIQKLQLVEMNYLSNITHKVRDSISWKSCDYALDKTLVSRVLKFFDVGTPDNDAFASRSNRRFPKFWTKEQDAFSKSWKDKFLWINPPFNQITQVIDKLLSEKAYAILIVPKWTWSIWWKYLMEHSTDHLMIARVHGMFLHQGKYVMQKPRWDAQAFYIDFSESWERTPPWSKKDCCTNGS